MKKENTNKKKEQKLLIVQVLEAKANPLFTEEQRQAVRFLRYNQTVPCAECGKRRKVMWTMLCSFYAHTMATPVLGKGKAHPPLTPVCGDHPIGPAWPEEENDERANPPTD